MALDRKIFYPSALINIDSHYPKIETGHLFTTDKEKDLFQQFINRTFSQFKDQATAVLKIKDYTPKKTESSTFTC